MPLDLSVPVFRRLLPYEYQYLTYQNGSVSRHRFLKNFFKISRIKQVVFRFVHFPKSTVVANFFSLYFRFINFQRINFCWRRLKQIKNRRWKRKFGGPRRRVASKVLLTPLQFFSFWNMYLGVFISRRYYKPIKRRVGSGSFLFQWFRFQELFWLFPAIPDFLYLNTKDIRSRKRSSYYLMMMLTRYRRFSFIQDRDLFRSMNFPIFYYTVPRMWQPDPSKFAFVFRTTDEFYQKYVL
jgi:hypothetical protein